MSLRRLYGIVLPLLAVTACGGGAPDSLSRNSGTETAAGASSYKHRGARTHAPNRKIK
jgi:hypothetical protein